MSNVDVALVAEHLVAKTVEIADILGAEHTLHSSVDADTVAGTSATDTCTDTG